MYGESRRRDVNNISHAIEDYEHQQKTNLLVIIQFNPELGRHLKKL